MRDGLLDAEAALVAQLFVFRRALEPGGEPLAEGLVLALRQAETALRSLRRVAPTAESLAGGRTSRPRTAKTRSAKRP